MACESQGVGLLAYRADEHREFITSDEVWFRGVQLNNAPDGCLYVADMYREILEHPQSIPPMIEKHLDLNSGSRTWGGSTASPRSVSGSPTGAVEPAAHGRVGGAVGIRERLAPYHGQPVAL